MVPALTRNLVATLCFILFSFFSLDCAGDIPPSGGPPDIIPPNIIKTVPDSNAVRVDKKTIELGFSEYVDRRSVEESIFISPYVGELEFDWSGTDVEITFSEPLRENTTYVVNVGTDVIDLRGRNRMATGFTLAFSTGDSIDRGFISGQVFDEKPEGVMIFAYELQGRNPDTLNPSSTKPDYIMQTGKGGMFALSNVAFGRYRVFAIRDEYRNFLYDRQVDHYGVAIGDVVVDRNHERVENVWFRLSQEDTARPFVSSVQQLDRLRLQVRFSEPIDSTSFDQAVFTLIDTLTTRSIPLAFTYFNRSSPSLASIVVQSPLDAGAAYHLLVRNLQDKAGNPLDTMHASADFVGMNRPDTVKALFVIKDLSNGTTGYPPERSVEINFGEPVRHEPLLTAITLTDTNSNPIVSKLRWLNPTDLVLAGSLKYDTWYQVRMALDSVVDLAGNRYSDSVSVTKFKTIDLRSTGTIEGMVADEQGDLEKGGIYITAKSVDAAKTYEKTIVIQSSGKVEMDRLVEGRYTLRAFRDADGNGKYSYGNPYPFVPSERFTSFPDTIKVRARWGVEGVLLKFKQ